MPKSRHYNYQVITNEDRELFRDFVDNSTIFDKDKLSPFSSHKKQAKFLNYRLITFAQYSASDKLFYNQGANQKTITKIKQGRVKITASVDLHGLTLEEACIEMAHFIYQHQRHNYLHIIHGKGYNSNSLSKLKTQVFIYLQDHPQVMTICSSPEHLGSTGAVIIKLKHA
jgi:DNA-nicking Smr family endonuclease